MNKLIRLLSDQADEFTDNKIQMQGEYHPDWHDIRDQKFAELIVEQCLNQCYNRGMNDSPYVGQLKAAEYIEEHFEIKSFWSKK
jgi:hypothetical protein